MTKVLFAFLVLVLQAKAFAGLTLSSEGENFNCEPASSYAYHCEGDNGKVLLLKDGNDYLAIGTEGNEPPRIKGIKRIEDSSSGEPLYESSNSADHPHPFYGSTTLPESRSTKAASVIEVYSNVKGVDDEWAVDFYNQTLAYLKKESNSPSTVEIQDLSGTNYKCSIGESKKKDIQCSYYSCVDPQGSKSLAYIPKVNRTTYLPVHLVSMNNGKADFKWNGFKVVDKASADKTPLYDIPKMNIDQGLSDKLFVPQKYQANASSVMLMADPFNSKFLDGEAARCGGDNDVAKLLAEQQKLTAEMQDDILKEDLTHYLTMLNGQMISVFVNANRTQNLGCRYDDMILSEEAAKHLAFLDKARAKPANKFLTPTEAQQLFDKAKNMTDIPFEYKQDGCYARAHIMARRFEEMGVPVEKVWIKGDLKVPGTKIEWNFHVAPVVNVKNEKGEIVKYVIDPSLTDKAVPVDDWVAIMDKGLKGGAVKTSFPFPENAFFYQKAAVAFSSTDIYLPDNNEQRTEKQNMDQARDTLIRYSDELEKMKSKWISL